MSAVFQYNDSFTISGRGLVLLGEIAEGAIHAGSRIALPDASGGSRLERITSIEGVRKLKDDGSVDLKAVGLVLGEIDDSEIPAVRKGLKCGDKLTVEDPEPGYLPPLTKKDLSWGRRIKELSNPKIKQRRLAMNRLTQTGFYALPPEGESPRRARQIIIDHGADVFQLFWATGRQVSALYKDLQGFPWMKDTIVDMVSFLAREGIHLAIKRKDKKISQHTEAGEITVTGPYGPPVDIPIEPGDDKMLRVAEDFSRDRYTFTIGERTWEIWDAACPIEERCILERQKFMDLLNELLAQRHSRECVWHCWGEKGGESLFIFLIEKQHRIIEEESLIFDKISPVVEDCPWPLEWGFFEDA